MLARKLKFAVASIILTSSMTIGYSFATVDVNTALGDWYNQKFPVVTQQMMEETIKPGLEQASKDIDATKKALIDNSKLTIINNTNLIQFISIGKIYEHFSKYAEQVKSESLTLKETTPQEFEQFKDQEKEKIKQEVDDAARQDLTNSLEKVETST